MKMNIRSDECGTVKFELFTKTILDFHFAHFYLFGLRFRCFLYGIILYGAYI